MDIETMLNEALLRNGVATRRGLLALLAFWRAWAHVVPAVAKITDDDLANLNPDRFWYRPTYYVPELNRHIVGPAYDPTPDIEALHRRRALWHRIRAILDLPDDEAVDALDALVNGSHDDDLLLFYGTLRQALPYPDPPYEDYLQHFYTPFQRHVYPRLKPPVEEAADAVPDWVGPALEAIGLGLPDNAYEGDEYEDDDEYGDASELVTGTAPQQHERGEEVSSPRSLFLW